MIASCKQPNNEKQRREELEARLLAHEGDIRAHINARIAPRLRQKILVDDILQETWVSALRAVPEFQPAGRHGFLRWLKTVANRRILDAIRAMRGASGGRLIRDADRRRTSLNRLLVSLSAAGKTPSRITASTEAIRALEEALEALPANRRRAIEMRYMQGYSRGEIAAQLGKSTSAVAGLLHHGKRQLRRKLGDFAKYLSGELVTRDATE
jgi:RNA polymerase sigma factor (sigma-70 family)